MFHNSNTQTKQYTSVRWSEFNRNDCLCIKERYFSSSKALEAFVTKLENKSNFNEIIA